MVHFDQNNPATYKLPEAMRRQRGRKLAFTSTTTVYGETKVMATLKNYTPHLDFPLRGVQTYL
ncbi:hypothetical protein ACSAZK_09335 [Methanosarcina sp. Mfa9]|uniref:hypothetical protein n=1 Tax=Methanosarcina sp. Mfa9 TaxID=3439063 RepID=UPI003F82E186